MSWIQVILEWLHGFWPMRVVRQDQRGIRLWRGKATRELGPDFWFFAPLLGEIVIMPVKPDVINMSNQFVTTADDVTVCLSVNIEYEIADITAAVLQVQSVLDNLGDAASRHIAKRVRGWTYAQLVEGLSDLERTTKGTMTTYVRDWGITILDVGFTNFARTRVYTLPRAD